jgi:hypothetical protein
MTFDPEKTTDDEYWGASEAPCLTLPSPSRRTHRPRL